MHEDWVDPGLFGHFGKLLAECDPTKVFLYYDLRGQDCILGCVTREQFKALRRLIPAVQPLA